MERMQLSTVVIAGGSEPDLFECLLSLGESKHPLRETIVVDNSLQGLQYGISVSFGGVRVARPSEPLTFAQAVNFGVREAASGGAESVLLLNDDVTVHPNAVGILVEAAAGNGLGIYAPEIWPYRSGEARMRFRIDWAKRLIVSERAALNGALTDIDYAEGSALLVPVMLFDRLGGFDEDLGFYYEDADFSLRARAAGFSVKEVAGARVWHKGSVSAGKGLSPFKAYWRARNTMKFALKHRDRASVVTNAVYHFGGFVLLETLRSGLRALGGSRRDARVVGAILRGTWDFLTGNGHKVLGQVPREGEFIEPVMELLRPAS